MRLKVKDFNLADTLESGQFFGFERAAGNNFIFRLEGVSIKLRQSGGVLYGDVNPGRAFTDALIRFFDLERDLEPVYAILRADPRLSPALKYRGLRLLRQDPWEAAACFILSSNNNVKRIRYLWRNLSEKIGTRPGIFPDAAEVAASSETFLRRLGLGYRAGYLLETARIVAGTPGILEALIETPYPEARETVMEWPGVGPKVADCILLYGLGRLEAFPVDTWIDRVMRRLYFKGKKTSSAAIRELARERFGAWAGYVQQYLFHAGRMGTL
jgi:N-glycosylase/DNA lyase